MCYWFLDLLLQRSPVVKMNGIVSSTILLNTGTPQGCVLSPLQYSLLTNDWVSHHSSVQLLMFTDGTTLEGLVTNSEEFEYRHVVNRCRGVIITTKTREMIVDGRGKPHLLPFVLVVTLSKGWLVSNVLAL